MEGHGGVFGRGKWIGRKDLKKIMAENKRGNKGELKSRDYWNLGENLGRIGEGKREKDGGGEGADLGFYDGGFVGILRRVGRDLGRLLVGGWDFRDRTVGGGWGSDGHLVKKY